MTNMQKQILNDIASVGGKGTCINYEWTWTIGERRINNKIIKSLEKRGLIEIAYCRNGADITLKRAA